MKCGNHIYNREKVKMSIANPKLDPHRLARVVYYPRFYSLALSKSMLSVCDRRSYVGISQVIRRARVYRHVYAVHHAGIPYELVDDWTFGVYPTQCPLATVYCSAEDLLKWSAVTLKDPLTAVSGELVHKGRLEMHRHVKRMDEYFKQHIALETRAPSNSVRNEIIA